MATKKNTGRGLDEFRAKHDKKHILLTKIRAGLAELGESYEYERDFSRRCGVATHQIALMRVEFPANVVELHPDGNGRIAQAAGRSQAKFAWAGTAKFAKAMRAIISK